jgi:hypothetical protein
VVVQPIRTLSGVSVRFKTDAEALAESIERFAVGGRIAVWCVVELLPLLKPHHWAAYAADAGILPPSAETIAEAVRLFRERIGYVSTGLTVAPKHDQTADTQPAIESSRSI